VVPELAHGEVVADQDGGAGELGEPPGSGAVGVPAGQVGQCPGGFHEPGVGSGADGEVGEGRRPATPALQRSASACICSSEANSRPRQKLSRTYGIGRSTGRSLP